MAPMDERERVRRRQKTNIIVAKFIPAFLTAVVIYASYVFVGPLCVNYLINVPHDARAPQRVGTAIALPIVFFFLLILMAACYFRLLYIVTFDPGYLPQKRAVDELSEKQHVNEKRTFRACTKTRVAEGQELVQLEYEAILRHGAPAPAGIEEFWTKDAFVCDRNGLPNWCHTCGIWKADRVHHSRDVGRCVKKMDHFCPWVGGMVGENGFKFFVQFNVYASVFSLYTMIVMAYFVAEAEHLTGTVGDVQWVVVLGLGGFFAIFTFGLAFTSLQYTFVNVTTVENIDRAKRTMYIAVLLPPDTQGAGKGHAIAEFSVARSGESDVPLASEIDDPSHQSYFSSQRSVKTRQSSRDVLAASIWQGTITYPLDKLDDPTQEHRTFAILRTPPGMNPWNLGWKHNLASVFGTTLQSMVFPYVRSPCTDHSSNISRYPFGWEFEQLLEDAKLTANPQFVRDLVAGTKSSEKHKKKRRLAEGWQNGERPDAWILEKEARRVRREQRQSGTLPS